jgi:hypothetical protein
VRNSHRERAVGGCRKKTRSFPARNGNDGGVEERSPSVGIDGLRERIAAAGSGPAGDELLALRREIDAIQASLAAARDAGDAALVEFQLRRLGTLDRAVRISRLRSLIETYDVAVRELEATSDPAVAGLILRLHLRRTRVEQELVLAERP